MKRIYRKLSHTIWYCKYHVIFCPKYRFRVLKGELKEYSCQQFYSLVKQKDMVEIEEMNIQPDNVHMIISIPPKYSISSIMGFMKGKCAINLFKHFDWLGKRFWGRHFWAKGYCVSTIGFDEEQIKAYVKYQKKKEKEAEQLGLNFDD